jgi:subtilisin family serine protease
MRLRNCLFTLLILISVFLSFNKAQGRTLVKLKDSAGSAAALSLQSARPGWRYLRGLDIYVVEESGESALPALRKEGAIDAMERDREIELASLPDDPLLKYQGWIRGEGLDIGILQAWNWGVGDPEVTVALIDTGIDLNHPDLRGNLWTNEGEVAGNRADDDGDGRVDDLHGYNFWDHNADVQDENNHGSHLAGIIGAVGNNGIGVAGINWRVRLMPLKFTDAHGNGSSAAAVEAIDYAIVHQADVINASWTLKIEEGLPDEDSLLRRAIEKAGEAGILFVTAAGNQFATGKGLNIDEAPIYPAKFSLDNLIAVAALDEEGNLASYSNYGPESVDLAAPGSGILSTVTKASYGVLNGSSVATAFVSGAAAFLLSLEPSLAPEQIQLILAGSAEEDASLINLVSSGGRLDLAASSAAVQNGAIPSVSETEQPRSNTSRQFTAPAGGCSLVP